MPALAAIQYSRETFDTRTAEMVGRRMASETFLKAWIRYSGADPITGWADAEAQHAAFLDHAAELGAAGARCATIGDERPLYEAGALWLADPGLGHHAWWRRRRRQDAYSLVGITHTLSTHAAQDLITGLLTAPVQPWDALICTSRAARSAVSGLLEAEAAYLRDRIGATACSGPELVTLPLGIFADRIAPDPAARAAWRAELGLAERDIAVLQFGRLSINAKAHPIPLYAALALASQRLGKPLHLILAGQPANDGQGAMYRSIAAAFAPEVVTLFVDGARPDAPGVRAAADIGTLLSDNIQETFGLAPVELMAAGLPVVTSDWDGLRDTIEHGVTGFLIDTIQPPPGAGDRIAGSYAAGRIDHGEQVAFTAQVTAVDIAQAADAFATLTADAGLRRKMGAAARRRVLERFDWQVVIGAYRDLLAELAQRRRAGGERAPVRPGADPWPSRADPFRTFAAYPTHRLDDATRLACAIGAPPSVRMVRGGAGLALVRPQALPAAEQLDAVCRHLAAGPQNVAAIAAAFATLDRIRLIHGLAWLLKFGFLVRVG